MIMTHVERFRAVMEFRPVDRLPVIEYCPYWDKTLNRWHEEGLPGELTDSGEIRDYLGLDCYRYAWVSPMRNGIERTITDERSYEAVRSSLYGDPVLPPNIRAKFLKCGEPQRRGEMVVWLLLDGFFWYPRTLFGIEPHLLAFYDQPALMHRMNADLLEFNLRVLDEVRAICGLSFVSIGEDVAYKQGPMISKAFFDEFLAPYYRQLVPAIRELGAIPMTDSDGNVHELVGWLEQVGVEGLMPFERRAGVDVARVRAEHPRFGIIGAFDKTVMRHGADAMRAEFERLLPVMKLGGFIPSVDHQTPPDVSLEQYRTYVQLLREYCEKAGGMVTQTPA
jgi:hypothetical protein